MDGPMMQLSGGYAAVTGAFAGFAAYPAQSDWSDRLQLCREALHGRELRAPGAQSWHQQTCTTQAYSFHMLDPYALWVDSALQITEEAALSEGPEGLGSGSGGIPHLCVCLALTMWLRDILRPSQKKTEIVSPPDMLFSWYSCLLPLLSSQVNAGVWNDYTGGVLSAAACGPMGADYQASWFARSFGVHTVHALKEVCRTIV